MKYILIIIMALFFTDTAMAKNNKPIKSFYAKYVYLYSEDGGTETKVPVKSLGDPMQIVVYGVDKDNYLIIKYKNQNFSLSKTDVSLHNWFEKSTKIARCKKTNSAIDSTSAASMGICAN